MQQPQIMLIEDSRTQSEYLSGLFRGEGWNVTCAPSGEAALDRLNEDRPDVVVVDYHLPGIGGDEFCRKVRMNVNTRDIPVLMLTMDAAEDAEERGLESGADDYLAKSVESDVLLLRVRALLRKSHHGRAIVPGERFSSRARLLAIDDSPTYLEYLARELESESYSVEKARSGREGLEKLERESFDGVLIDLEMPEMDGLELCRRISELRRSAGNPAVVMILTAHDNKGFMTKGLESGADDFVGKSSDSGILKARIRALLRRKFFVEENRRILNEFRYKELEASRARAEKEAAEMRAMMADSLARSNRELEAANRKLAEALEVTRAITQNAAEALFMLDAGGRITFANPAAERMFGYARAELLGRDFHEVFLKPGSAPLASAAYEGLFLTKERREIDVACSIAPIVQDGRQTASVLVAHDISEKKRAEEQLLQTQKRESVGMLAGGVAHDFNNILTSIIGNASILEADPVGDADKIRAILKSAERAAELTRQLLAYAGKGHWFIEQIDLSAAVEATLSLIRVALPRSAELRLELSSLLPAIEADRLQIQQVIMNLSANAGEAIDAAKGGFVQISTGTQRLPRRIANCVGPDLPAGDYIYLQVEDNGCGIDEQIRGKIFDPFFTTKFTGRGLGLAAVAGIVRAYRGGVTLRSAPGRGSTFRVFFPKPPAVAR